MRGMLQITMLAWVATACGTSPAGSGSAGDGGGDGDLASGETKEDPGPVDVQPWKKPDATPDAPSTGCTVGEACSAHNEFGTCNGTIKACTAGQATCSAAAPGPEICNQSDDDCNGVTDDNLCEDGDLCTVGICVGKDCAQKWLDCDDGDACTADTCSGGACKHAPNAGCNIGGQCVSAGTKNPKDACQVCNPLQSTSAWVSQNGLACDDGDACSTGDVCTGGVCKGKAMDCSGAGTACGAATCSKGKCVPAGGGGVCKPGEVAACAEPCDENVCGADCQWQGCAQKASAKCEWKSGNNHQCCAPGSWQFCSKNTCNWFPCQADAKSGCP